jgi:hypothetical protein
VTCAPRPLKGALLACFLYAVLTLALTWPMAARLWIMDAGDSAFFAWEMAWEVHALRTDPGSLPHANIFHPLRYTLGMDEPILGTTVLALPLLWFDGDAVFAFNVVRLLTFVLSGLTAYLLARSLGCAELPALVAGACFTFSPIRTDQVAHLSTLGTQWLPLVLLVMFRFFRLGRRRDALLAALLYVLEALACGYHGVVGLAVLPPVALVLAWGRWRRLPAGLVAAAVAAAGLLPLYLLHREALGPLHYVRSNEETVFYSASLEGFLATSSWNLLYGELTDPFRTTRANNLFPGLVLPALALGGAVAAWRGRLRPSRETMALVVLALSAAAVALGPEVRLFGTALFPGPYGLFRELVPVFKMIRVPSRSGPFLALALALIAGKVLSRWSPRPAVVVLIGTLALAETVIAPIPMPAWSQVVDTRLPPPPVYRWLEAQPGEGPVVELPILDINGIHQRPAHHESIYLVRSTRHWKRLVNGYAGIEPAPYVAVRDVARRFPSRESLDTFRGLGVRWLILHRGGYGPNQWARIERDLPRFASELSEVARFDGATVYELARAP